MKGIKNSSDELVFSMGRMGNNQKILGLTQEKLYFHIRFSISGGQPKIREIDRNLQARQLEWMGHVYSITDL